MQRRVREAFTLVEILIVVVILGILAAIVVQNFVSTTEDAAAAATKSELRKIRQHVDVYRVRNSGQLPPIEEGDGTWGPLISDDYLMAPPVNAWVGGDNRRVIAFGNAADDTFQSDYGWIYDPVTGSIWAGGFDADDQPLPH